MFEPIAVVTPEFEDIIAGIRTRHVQAVWAILGQHVGHESAIKRPVLLRQVRLAIRNARFQDRAVREICKGIRAAGIPLCGDRTGYWIGTPTETIEWARLYMGHAFSMLKIAHPLVKWARKMTADPIVRMKAERVDRQIELTLCLDEDYDNG